MKRYFRVMVVLMIALGIAGCAGMGGGSDSGSGQLQDIVEASARAVRHMRAGSDNESLNYLLQHARGAMIFPQVIKAGILFGGEGGKGVLAAKDETGQWSAPAFYGLGGGSVGFQAGVQRASLILVFMNEKVLNAAIQTDITLGVDAALAAGSASYTAGVTTGTAFKDIYYFSNIEGVFAGISLDGRIIGIDETSNHAFYGQEVQPREILLEQKYDHPAAAALKQALGTPAP
jgi:lipid-binding SYLF domain-containing protein